MGGQLKGVTGGGMGGELDIKMAGGMDGGVGWI